MRPAHHSRFRYSGMTDQRRFDFRGAEPMTGSIYAAWASLGYERGVLGLPTSGEIQEPQWIVQNFQHGTLNFDRQKGTVTRVIDGMPEELPPPSADGPPPQLERIKSIDPS